MNAPRIVVTQVAAPAATPEPAPIPNGGASMHDLVILDMEARKAFGLQKYGTVLQAHNGRDALLDAYQEVLDLTVYLKQELQERARRMTLEEAEALVDALDGAAFDAGLAVGQEQPGAKRNNGRGAQRDPIIAALTGRKP